jgi:hypothetical protein
MSENKAVYLFCKKESVKIKAAVLNDKDLQGLSCALTHCLIDGYAKDNELWYARMKNIIESFRS